MKQLNKTTREGFTLPEVLVSIAVLVVVIFSVTNLVVSIIRTNNENIHTLTAYGLAQEGLEAVRNIRDSNWLLGARYNGKLGALQHEIWGATFPDTQNSEEYYIVKYGVFDRPLDNPSIEQISSVTPWKLETVTGPDDEKTALRRRVDTNTGEVRFEHPEQLSTAGDPTPYRRYVLVENISPSSDFEMMRVTSVVEWEEQAREKEVRLVTELTDWNQGQL